MRLRSLLLLVSLLLPSFASAAATERLEAPHRISAVTVYPDRAMTTRSATLSLKPGSYLVDFSRLPVLVQDDSVRVTGTGSASVTIVGVEVKRAFAEQVPEKRAKELEQEIRALERKIGSIDARKAALASQRGFIDSIRVAWGDRISKELAAGKPTTGELNEALSFVGSGVAKVEEQARDVDEEKRQLKERIDALRRQRDEAIGSQAKESKTVQVALEVSRAGNLCLELSSIVPQGGWEPAYDVRLGADGKEADLVFRGVVRQQTGEDWQDVALTLSTARPALGGAPPELPPWHISFYRPPPPPVPLYDGGMAKAARAEDFRVGSALPAPQAAPSAPARYETAEVAQERTSVTFRIPRPVSIPSDGSEHGTVVATEKLPVALEFLAVPKLAPTAYLKSEIVNKLEYPLLPGKVNTFTGGNYTGSSWLKKIAPGEKFDLFFGTDEQVTVKREELKSHKEAGIFGKSRQTYRYRIEVQNFRKEAETITIHDQLPLSGDQEIKVSLDKPSVPPSETRPDGTLVWKIPLRAGEKKELTFDIVVEYPKDREVVGL
ncbi:mucoidy inhibitor MuiA family protein [Geomonas sp. RF6]|uniref:mucoidy inhibitor MuiA family protein n=1 Tax=Geomonas sp. RF6 TaxID=2897342 RepID=UPI001E5AAA5B|nr:mucoidy inhibitor MuiA family protein [Geomonas sp. RF6]UFS68702.1 mucoidy inhibitor MuiA family protein [Geomonas sp. RF6]